MSRRIVAIVVAAFAIAVPTTTVVATSANASLPVADTTVSQATATPAEGAYVGLQPARLMDTRPGYATVDGQFLGIGAIGEMQTRDVTVTGRGGVPATGVAAVALNITAVAPTAGTFVTAYPAGSPLPNASTINVSAALTAANSAIVKVGVDGAISLFNKVGATHVLVDVVGYFPTGPSYVPLVPQRIMDTRASYSTIDGVALGQGPLAANTPRLLQVGGRAGVPATGVAAVILNITAVGGTANSYLLAYPADVARPSASNVNFVKGATVANMVVSGLSANGQMMIVNSAGDSAAVVDVLGYIPTGTTYHSITPSRVFDSRVAAYGQSAAPAMMQTGDAFMSQATADWYTGAANGVGANAKAVFANITVVSPSMSTYESVYPTKQSELDTRVPMPSGVSNINVDALATRANLVPVQLGQVTSAGSTYGLFTVWNNRGTTHLVVDIVGWFE